MSGSGEVYVQPFPLTGAKYQITTSGGQDPVWSPDGKQLFCLPTDGANRQIMSVDIQTQPSLAMVAKSQVDPSKASSEQFNVTLNWFEELKQRVPVK